MPRVASARCVDPHAATRHARDRRPVPSTPRRGRSVARRALPPRGADRVGGDGAGVAGDGRGAAPQGRGEGAPPAPRGRPQLRAAVPPGGGGRGTARAPGDRVDLRHLFGVRHGSHRDGARARPDAAGAARRSDADRPVAGRGPRSPGRRGAGGGPPGGSRPPRHQAGQRPARGRRTDQGGGLRDRQGGRRGRPHPAGPHGGHGQVRGSRAGGGEARRRADRHLQPRHRALRDALRPSSVRGGQRGRHGSRPTPA